MYFLCDRIDYETKNTGQSKAIKPHCSFRHCCSYCTFCSAVSARVFECKHNTLQRFIKQTVLAILFNKKILHSLIYTGDPVGSKQKALTWKRNRRQMVNRELKL